MLHVIVEIFATSDVFFDNFNLKISRSRLLLLISNELGLTLEIRHSSSDTKF